MTAAGDTLTGLTDSLHRAARATRLLVATAFDGTLTSSETRTVDREAVRLLRALAELEHTEVAVVSGRALRDLALASRLPEPVRLVGSHGAETGPDLAEELDTSARQRLARLAEETRSLAAATPGARLEHKPAGLEVRLRGVDPGRARWVRERVRGGLGLRKGVWIIDGAEGVELTVDERDKGYAIDQLRAETGADAVIYLGDDETDEAAFARLRDTDLGIRVGSGTSTAGYRVDGPPQVREMLAELLEQRG